MGGSQRGDTGREVERHERAAAEQGSERGPRPGGTYGILRDEAGGAEGQQPDPQIFGAEGRIAVFDHMGARARRGDPQRVDHLVDVEEAGRRETGRDDQRGREKGDRRPGTGKRRDHRSRARSSSALRSRPRISASSTRLAAIRSAIRPPTIVTAPAAISAAPITSDCTWPSPRPAA